MTNRKAGIIAVSTWIALVLVSGLAYELARGDSFALLLTVLRILVVVPLAVALCIVALVIFDVYTPGDWLVHLTDDQHGNIGTKVGTALVVSSIIFGIFWVCIQG